MKSSYLVASVCSLAVLTSGLQAQTTVETGSNVASFARQANSSDFSFIAASMRVRLPMTVTSQLRQAGATTYATLFSNSTQTTVNLQEVAQVDSPNSSAGTSASNSSQSFVPGAHSIVVRYPAQSGAKFNVIATLSGSMQGTSAVSAEVDIDNNGRPDWSAKLSTTPATMRWQLTATASGLVIGMKTEGLATTGASGSSSYNGTLAIDIIPTGGNTGRCTFANVGSGCGPVLAASESVEPSGDVLTFTTTNATPRGVAVLVLGGTAINVPFPGTRCYLYTQPLIMVSQVVGARGATSDRFNLPKDFEGKFYGQNVVLSLGGGNIVVQSTNGISVDCRKG